ncbi:MAG TPA: hypothetical protein VGH73_09720 [Thermoanaerobaculia bacterium]|jgi:hypothetical protein
MKKLAKLLFAAALIATAFLAAPPRASADTPVCNRCALTGDCFDCCRCDGGTVLACSRQCP